MLENGVFSSRDNLISVCLRTKPNILVFGILHLFCSWNLAGSRCLRSRYGKSLMMTTKTVLETSVFFDELKQLFAQEDFI